MNKIILNCGVFVAFLTVLFFSPQVISAKSYTISTVAIDVTLSQDGTAVVKEERYYNFHGSYTFAYQEIAKNPDATKTPGRTDAYTLTNFSFCDEMNCYKQLKPTDAAEADVNRPAGTFYVTETAEKYLIKWFYRADESQKKFILEYTIENPLTLHNDVAELYWQLIGSEWDVPQSDITATVHLPSGLNGDQLQAWLHGPLNGTVRIQDAQTITFTSPSLALQTFFEARVLMPKLPQFSGAVGSNSRASIIAQEQRFIEQTEKQKQSETQKQYYYLAATLTASLLSILLAVRSLTLFWKYGRDPALPAVNQAGRLWEPPSDIDPAQVDQLLRMKQYLKPQVFTATILSLVQDRFYSLIRSDQEEGFWFFKGYSYYLQPLKPTKQPSTIQEAALSLLNWVGTEKKMLGGTQKEVIPLSKISNWVQSNKIAARKFFLETLPKIVTEENVKEGFFDELSHKNVPKGITVFIASVATVIQVVSFMNIGDTQYVQLWILLCGLTGTFISVFATILVSALKLQSEKRTPQGALEAASWKAFKKHMKDYRSTEKYPIDSLILWEKYLVYGTVLGVSLKVLETFLIHLPPSEQVHAAQVWGGINSSGSGADFSHSFASISQAMNSLSQASSSSYGASGVGSSGGSSGGGGGGGGGAGHAELE